MKDLQKFSNVKFHEHPSCGSRVVPLGTRLKTRIITHEFYGHLTRYFALTEERKSRTFENMPLRRTSGQNRVNQESDYLYNEKLHDLSPPPNKVRQTKDDKMGGTSKHIGKRKDISICWTTILKCSPMLGK